MSYLVFAGRHQYESNLVDNDVIFGTSGLTATMDEQGKKTVPIAIAREWKNGMKECTDSIKKKTDRNCQKMGGLGPVLGYPMAQRAYHGGQADRKIKKVIETIRKNPYSAEDIPTGPVVIKRWPRPYTACHLLSSYVSEGKLSCQITSAARYLPGGTVKIAPTRLLTMMIAQVTGIKPATSSHNLGRHNLYINHLEQVDLQLHASPVVAQADY